MEPAIVERFAALFAGRADVWGALHGEAVKERVTLEHHRRHLAGRVSLGVYPLLPNGLIRWLAVDIDRLDLALALRLWDALSAFGITQGVYVEKSKGKGYHVIILFSDWAPAWLARRVAKAALNEAGLPPTTEVFPKQDRLTQQVRYGNYLNLPYFGGGNPEGRRMMLDPDAHHPIPLADWLDAVQLFPAAALEAVAAALPKPPNEAPSLASPKTRAAELLKANHATGTRRPTLVSLAGHLRLRGVAEDVAVELLLPWAQLHFMPPLPDAELVKHIRGIYRRYRAGGSPQAQPAPAGSVLSLEQLDSELFRSIAEGWR